MTTPKRIRISGVNLPAGVFAKVAALAEIENRSVVGQVATLVEEALRVRERVLRERASVAAKSR